MGKYVDLDGIIQEGKWKDENLDNKEDDLDFDLEVKTIESGLIDD